MIFDSAKLLGENSYPAIVKEIYEKIQNTKCQTMTGDELCQEIYKRLNESITPMLELKDFTTKAEKIAGDDVTIKELIDFVRKRSVTGDLNFIINLCKEEHFKEMGRLNHPSPAQTIKAIEEKFSEPGSVIEQGIKAGLFDGLKSKLLNKVKSDLGSVEIKKLNESQTLFNGPLVQYSPVGIKYEDLKNNQVVYLLESEIIGLSRETGKLSALPKNAIDIPEGYGLLINAVNSCAFNPEKDTFGLNENWDFELQLEKNSKVTVNGKEIQKNQVKNLLLESINLYEQFPEKVQNFNKSAYLKDADNFVMLIENANKLIKFSNLQTLKNLNENSYLIFDKEGVYTTNEPKILASKDLKNKLFESYEEMIYTAETILHSPIKSLFENHLKNEQLLINNRNKQIVDLSEKQKDIDNAILKVRNLKSFADSDSPAMEKLDEQERILSEELDNNLKDLNFFKNEFKLY